MSKILGLVQPKIISFQKESSEKQEKAPEKGSAKKFDPDYTQIVHINGDTIEISKATEMLPDDSSTQTAAIIKQDAKLPAYALNGLKGDKNANFFEFMQLGKIPYLIGGPMLVWCFAAGGKGAVKPAKQIAAGVALYYLAASAAKVLIDKPVKYFKGVDLNRKYSNIVPLKAETRDGSSGKKTEFHDAHESIDFTRFDLYKNSDYDEIARKMGVDKKLADPDSTVQPYVRRLIVASRAWKSALIIPLAGLSAGLSNYKGWEDFGNGMKQDWQNIFNNEGSKVKGIGNLVNNHFLKPVKNSFVQLWSSEGKSGIGKHTGKAWILGSLGLVALANYNIYKIAFLKKDKFITPPAEDLGITRFKKQFGRSSSTPSAAPLSQTKDTYIY